MIVGVAVVELRVHESQSLKEKRGVVRKIAGRLRHRFNVSVAEVGGQDLWQRAVIGLAAAGSDEEVVRKTLARALELVDAMHLAEILGSEVEVLRMPLSEAPFSADDEADGDLDLPWSSAGDERREPREG